MHDAAGATTFRHDKTKESPIIRLFVTDHFFSLSSQMVKLVIYPSLGRKNSTNDRQSEHRKLLNTGKTQLTNVMSETESNKKRKNSDERNKDPIA